MYKQLVPVIVVMVLVQVAGIAVLYRRFVAKKGKKQRRETLDKAEKVINPNFAVNKRPTGFTILSFIGVCNVIGSVIACAGYRMVEWHLFNYILCILTSAITVVLIYGLWCVKKWTLKVFIICAIASMLHMIVNGWVASGYYSSITLVGPVLVSLWCLFVFFLVGRYINGRLKEKYPTECPSPDKEQPHSQ